MNNYIKIKYILLCENKYQNYTDFNILKNIAKNKNIVNNIIDKLFILIDNNKFQSYNGNNNILNFIEFCIIIFIIDTIQ